MRKRSALGAVLRGVLLPAAAVAVLLFFAVCLNSLDSGRAGEDKRQLEEALRRGCVACYAADGVYPPDLEQLTRRCGIQVDESRYVVYYSVFGSNLMPEITVLEKP